MSWEILNNHNFIQGKVVQIYHKVLFYGSQIDQFVVLGVVNDDELVVVKILQDGSLDSYCGKYLTSTTGIENPNISITDQTFEVDQNKIPISFTNFGKKKLIKNDED